MGGNDIVGDSADEILIDNDANSGGVRIISQGAALTVFNSSGPKIFATASGAELTLGGALGAGASLNVGTSQVVDLNTGVSGGVLVKGSGGVKIETSTGFPVEIASSNLTLPRDTTANRLDVNGNIRYNTTTDKFEGYEDGAWINIAGGGGGYGECSMQGNGTVTTINSVGVFEDVDGTAVAGLLSDFTFAGADNSLTYTGTATKVFRIIASGAFLGKKDKDLIFSIAKNGTEQSKFRQTVQPKDNNKEQPFSISGLVSFATNDKINLVVTNIASTDDPTIFDMNLSVME